MVALLLRRLLGTAIYTLSVLGKMRVFGLRGKWEFGADATGRVGGNASGIDAYAAPSGLEKWGVVVPGTRGSASLTPGYLMPRLWRLESDNAHSAPGS